ncbi:MAG: hypothetical protein IPP71_18310 [Bacteroidetes bacterium]|nr:hypothetical protein [Bacteroidota bacterium]
MKKIIQIVMALCLLPLFSLSQWQWGKQFGGNSFNAPHDVPLSLLTDGNNSFTIGFYGGPLHMPDDTLPSNGINQIFITKFNTSGTQIWAQSLGGNYNQFLDYEYGEGVIDNNSNSIFLTGIVIGDVSFGGITSYSSSGLGDIFLTKMDLNGNYVWVDRIITSGKIYPKYLSVLWKIYLITQTEDSSQFGNFNLPPEVGIIQYDTAGNCLSAEYYTPSQQPSLIIKYVRFIRK